ncbi:MAG: hypothetical protein Fur002_22040 [Anaerolineales bacterium]
MSVKIIPVYNSKGDAEAYLAYPYLFNRSGEWVGFVTPQRVVYSVLGEYVGTLSDDPRILRKREVEYYPRLAPPPPPVKISLPATVPLAPLMSELTHSTVDVLLEEPERLHTSDSGEFKNDMD